MAGDAWWGPEVDAWRERQAGRRAAPRKPAEAKRTVRVEVHLTPPEWGQLEQEAERAGVSPGSWPASGSSAARRRPAIPVGVQRGRRFR
jgi:hypothetical protein